MLRKFALLVALACVFAAYVAAQGLTTTASKDDWEEINFEFNSAVLSDGYPSLLRLADLLHTHTGYHVKVEGNTDNLGSTKYNEKLGLARASTVRDFLVKYGATAGQIEVGTRGKVDPKYPGYKNTYSKTDVARWMNRRVVITVADEQGKTVSAGGAAEAIRAMDQVKGPAPRDCCDDILKRLDKLDDIARMLKELMDQNAGLRKEVDSLKSQQAALEKQVSGAPKPLTEQQTAQVVEKKLEEHHQPKFSLLGLNVGSDDQRNVTFSGRGRFFAPFAEHFAFQAQGEYLYYHTQREGQLDFGLVDRIGNFQGGLFTSFKHVNLRGAGSGGTLGQGALTVDYLFKLGKVGVFGTKGFLDNAVLDRRNAVFATGQFNADGSQVIAVAPNVFLERYLKIVDQVGVSTTLGLWGNNYVEANIGYLRSAGREDRPGGTVRFVFPIKDHFALTAEGGVNETLLGPASGVGPTSATGRAVFGVQWGNFIRPKEYLGAKGPVPVDIPRVRYEVLTRRIKIGTSLPIADAGPDQIGVPAGNITLNGSNSRDPNGLQLTYQWVQETGPSVSISGATAAIANFTAAAGQAYTFRLTVRNTDGQSASARTRVTTRADEKVQILFFLADPRTINAGQASTLSWRVLNADTVTITPNIGKVNPANGTVSVSPTDTTTYKLTATNATSEENATVTVQVLRPEPRILVCTATPMNIMQGESARIIYNTQNADTVSIDNGIGNVAKSGSVVVSPSKTTTYTITARNQFGSDTCAVSIQVTPGQAPRIIRFSAAPLTIQAGATSTLVWQVENAKTVSISPNVGSVGLVGTQDVQPNQTTTYTLTATNDFGQVSAVVIVTVQVPPPPPANPVITSFTANPPASTNPGSPVVLTCLATNATRVVISGVGNVDASGNITVNPLTTTTYACVAINSVGVQATAVLTVPVTKGPPTGPGPVVVINGIGGDCKVGTGITVCETLNRQLTLDLTGSTSPTGNFPLSFLTVTTNLTAAVLSSTSSQPIVQLSQTYGDYFFTVTVTDSRGVSTTVIVDIRLVRTSPQN